jgi:cytochrome c-type biogenesis protein CcmE
MDLKTRRRLVFVTFAIAVVLVVTLAYVGGGSTSKVVSVAQAYANDLTDARVEVSGTVVSGSYSSTGDALSFEIFDPEGDASQTLQVVYSGAAPETFGDGITAICTGRLDGNGVLHANELIVKCPSKYESAENIDEAFGVVR